MYLQIETEGLSRSTRCCWSCPCYSAPSQPPDGSKEDDKLCPSNPKEECQTAAERILSGPMASPGPRSCHLHRGRPRPCQHADWLRYHIVLLPIPTAARFGQGSGWVRCRLRCDQANEENTARSVCAPLKYGAAVCGSRLKIATDVAGMLGSSESPARTGRSFSLTRMKIDSAQRGTLSS